MSARARTLLPWMLLCAALWTPRAVFAQDDGTDGTDGTDATDGADGTDGTDGTGTTDSSGGTDEPIYDTGKDGRSATDLAGDEGGCAGLTATTGLLLVGLAWRRRQRP